MHYMAFFLKLFSWGGADSQGVAAPLRSSGGARDLLPPPVYASEYNKHWKQKQKINYLVSVRCGVHLPCTPRELCTIVRNLVCTPTRNIILKEYLYIERKVTDVNISGDIAQFINIFIILFFNYNNL